MALALTSARALGPSLVMRPHHSATVRDALGLEVQPLLVERILAILVIACTAMAGSMILDVRAAPPNLPIILLTKFAGTWIYACGVLSVWTARKEGLRRTLRLVVPSVALLTVVPNAVAVALHDQLLAIVI